MCLAGLFLEPLSPLPGPPGDPSGKGEGGHRLRVNQESPPLLEPTTCTCASAEPRGEGQRLRLGVWAGHQETGGGQSLRTAGRESRPSSHHGGGGTRLLCSRHLGPPKERAPGRQGPARTQGWQSCFIEREQEWLQSWRRAPKLKSAVRASLKTLNLLILSFVLQDHIHSETNQP